MARRTPEKPLHKQCAEFVIFHLADKRAFHPFTGGDYDAWHAYVNLIRLHGRYRSDDVVAALRAVVHCAQTRNEDVMAVFKKAIPCILDWSDEPRLWVQIAPRAVLDEVSGARVRRAIERAGLKGALDGRLVTDHPLTQIIWPCDDGPRVCNHERSVPSKHAGYQECKECGAHWADTAATNR